MIGYPVIASYAKAGKFFYHIGCAFLGNVSEVERLDSVSSIRFW